MRLREGSRRCWCLAWAAGVWGTTDRDGEGWERTAGDQGWRTQHPTLDKSVWAFLGGVGIERTVECRRGEPKGAISLSPDSY